MMVCFVHGVHKCGMTNICIDAHDITAVSEGCIHMGKKWEKNRALTVNSTVSINKTTRLGCFHKMPAAEKK